MNNYLKSRDPDKCSGCRACEQACPQNAITMREDAEGFLYPHLDQAKCIDCNICSAVCPVENKPEGNPPIEAYALQHYNQQILENSSSGGAFRLFADDMLRQGGCVVGCVWDENNHPVLTIADRQEHLQPMQGSKYVFSDTNTVYSEVKRRLNAGQMVLFTGAPCQCAGLLRYLKKPYKNLYTADFLCHGMPSQLILDAYLSSLEKNTASKIYDIRFRDKSIRGWGRSFSYKFLNAAKEKKRVRLGWTDTYSYGFAKGYFNRYICYSCPFQGENHFTDITFCDYWGVQKRHPEISCDKGVSAVVFHTKQGKELQKRVYSEALWVLTDIESIARENRSILYPPKAEIPPLRRTIISQLKENGWRNVEKRHLRTKHFFLKKVWYRLPRFVTDGIKVVLRKT